MFRPFGGALLGFLSLSCSLLSVSGVVVEDVASLHWKHYDFVVVGAGTAGALVASRLSENPWISVLLLEAGVSDQGPDAAIISTPFFAGQGANTRLDWNYTTTPQTHLNNRVMALPRGHVLGGSSSINNMLYSRGPADEYDRIAAVSGDRNWSWNRIRRLIYKNEKHVPAWDNHDDSGQYDPRFHGYGPVHTSVTGSPRMVDYLVMNSTAPGSEFPFNLDTNSGDSLGMGWLQSTISGGERMSSSRAFLHPAMNRWNLDIVTGAHVTKLKETTRKSFRTVSYVKNGRSFEVTAKKEVILSGGTIGTPHILMLSGIGPRRQLRDAGIDVKIDSPDVGQNLQDQPFLITQFKVNEPTFGTRITDPSVMEQAAQQYAANKTGFFADSFIGNLGHFRLPSEYLQSGDPAAGRNAPHYTIAYLELFLPNQGQTAEAGDWVSGTIQLLSPKSRGSVTVKSSDPFTHPEIDPAFLSSPWDVEAMKGALKAMFRFMDQPHWHAYIDEIHPEAANVESDDAAAEEFIRRYTATVYHPVGTAAIGKVVRADLSLKGARDVRIVDASVLPAATAGFPQAEVYIVAERAVEIIKAAHFIP